jgi:hypothetical protein
MTEAEAWAEYRETIEAMRRLVLDHPLTSRNDQVRAEAMTLIHQAQASAYAMVIAPRPDFPRWFAHAFFEPNVFNWNLPNPDFLYQCAFLDGRRTYRITGRRNTGRWADIQSVSGAFGAGGVVYNGNSPLDGFEIAPDGTLEIIASATTQPGNWLKIDAASRSNWLHIRRLVSDWEAEIPPSFAIERIDGAPGDVNLTEAEAAERIVLAARYIRFVIEKMNLGGIARLDPVEDNEFILIGGEGLKATTANPVAVYGQARYAFEPHEAVIVETEIPEAIYWNIHLGDIWNQTRDFVHHHSCLNDCQAVLDSDGKFRAVIALEDPGVANWLDPVGTTFGRICTRWYGGKTSPLPTARRVPLSELRNHLPADTAAVTPAERREIQRRRTAAMLRHWGY